MVVYNGYCILSESSNNGKGTGLISTPLHWLCPKFWESMASLAVRLEPAWADLAFLGCLHHDIHSFEVSPERRKSDFVQLFLLEVMDPSALDHPSRSDLQLTFSSAASGNQLINTFFTTTRFCSLM
jgi:hypothetical protein